MYNKFFGFKEKPFRLVPNPEYLFLSKSHEEALAHLTYAITQGDGFVEITGEVGTGKTTLCRVFLENLDKSIEAAYIFNPKLDALQLLKAINDEFGIDSGPDNIKDLIDGLNTFLIEKKGAGQKVLVLIDEAQNLSLEVLEQLRLLSNLETTREKLLQIILVGQPELGDMLSSHRLRQLGQRITINCRLSPLTYEETRDYIRHRIALASHRAGPPFDKAAYRAIYEYSHGIPRLINIACDRALLNAYSRNSFKITAPIAREAIHELRHGKTETPSGRRIPALIGLAAVVVALVGALFYFNSGSDSSNSVANGTDAMPAAPGISGNIQPGAAQRQDIGEADVVPSQGPDQLRDAAAGVISQPAAEETPVIPPARDAAPDGETFRPETLASSSGEAASAPLFTVADPAELDAVALGFLNFLKSLNSRHSRNTAILQALRLWNPATAISEQIMLINSEQPFFREAAESNALLIQPLATAADMRLVQTLNLPAILTFYLPNHAWPKYLAVVGLDQENVYLDAGDQGGINAVDRRILLRFWSGEAHVVWKNFLGLESIVSENSAADTVKTLKTFLRDLAYAGDFSSSEYDAETKRLIKDIQRKNGLETDGIVGPFTKIVMYNENPDFIKPSLAGFAASETENGT